MEIILIRVNVVEDRETKMARFMRGLNREIVDMLELHYYMNIKDLVELAINVC